MRHFPQIIQRFRRAFEGGFALLALLPLNPMSIPVLLDSLQVSSLCTMIGAPSIAALSTVPSLSSERILGMQPLTFFCFAIPIVVQAVVLLIWALRWRSPD